MREIDVNYVKESIDFLNEINSCLEEIDTSPNYYFRFYRGTPSLRFLKKEIYEFLKNQDSRQKRTEILKKEFSIIFYTEFLDSIRKKEENLRVLINRQEDVLYDFFEINSNIYQDVDGSSVSLKLTSHNTQESFMNQLNDLKILKYCTWDTINLRSNFEYLFTNSLKNRKKNLKVLKDTLTFSYKIEEIITERDIENINVELSDEPSEPDSIFENFAKDAYGIIKEAETSYRLNDYTNYWFDDRIRMMYVRMLMFFTEIYNEIDYSFTLYGKEITHKNINDLINEIRFHGKELFENLKKQSNLQDDEMLTKMIELCEKSIQINICEYLIEEFNLDKNIDNTKREKKYFLPDYWNLKLGTNSSEEFASMLPTNKESVDNKTVANLGQTMESTVYESTRNLLETKKLKWNVPVNALYHLFAQLSEFQNSNGKTPLNYTPKVLAQFLINSFEGLPTLATVQREIQRYKHDDKGNAEHEPPKGQIPLNGINFEE